MEIFAAVVAVISVIAIVLLNQRGFWFCAFGLGAVLSWIGALVSLLAVDILGTIGFYLLGLILIGLAGAVTSRRS